MKKVIVGSKNPVKLEVTQEAFNRVFPHEQFEFVTYEAQSGVPDQPRGFAETKLGAQNRSNECRSSHPDGDYFVGLEGGIEEINEEYWAFAIMCIQDKTGTVGYGRTGSYVLPQKITILIKEGYELGVAADIVFNEQNSKHKEGTIGLLSDGVVTRKDFYRDALIFALIPFLHQELYS